MLHLKRPLRFPGSNLRDLLFAALRASPFVRDGLRNLDHWKSHKIPAQSSPSGHAAHRPRSTDLRFGAHMVCASPVAVGHGRQSRRAACAPHAAPQCGSPCRPFQILFWRRLFFAGAFPDTFLGTFLPSLRASDSPIAIACLGLFTLPPLPRLSLPFFMRSMARSTSLPALLEYFPTTALHQVQLPNG